MNIMSIFEMLVFFIMLVVVAILKYRRNFPAWQSILFSVWTCFVIFLNAPNFLVIIEGTAIKQSLLTMPFSLYEKWGTGYIIVSNILLAAAGIFLDENRNCEITYSSKDLKRIFNDFPHNATNLRIIGRDLDFLLCDDYKVQREKFNKLKKNVKILCERTDDKGLIELYYQLVSNGNQVRCYTTRDGIANLKGQIKTDEKNTNSGIFVTKFGTDKKRYLLTEMRSGYLLSGVCAQFERTFLRQHIHIFVA